MPIRRAKEGNGLVERRPAVFLDRDGVINRGFLREGKTYAPRRLEDFRLLPGARAAVRALSDAGYLIVVVTNQPDIGNGLVDPGVVAAMHNRLRRALPLVAIEMCPHKQTDGCSCRKPKPGMLRRAAKRYYIDLSASFMVGDRWSDVVAGHKAGCYTIFVDRGYDACRELQPDIVVRSLPEATRHILTVARPSERRRFRRPRGEQR